MKIYKAEKMDKAEAEALMGGNDFPAPGTVITDGKSKFAVTTQDGAISILELQISGKKRMEVKDFLLGFRDASSYGTSIGTSAEFIRKNA